MFNLLYMDCRRLFRSRGLYILLGVTVGLLFVLNLLVAGVSDPAFLEAMQQQGAEIDEIDRQMAREIRSMSQLTFAQECLGSGFLLIMSGIGMTLFASSDFSSGYIKNICFARPCRRNYVFSKALLAGIYSGILTVVGVLTALGSPFLLGLHLKADSLLHIAQYMFWMWLPHWAFALMALALVVLTGNTTMGIILAVLSGGGVTAALLQPLCQLLHWPPLEQYLLSSMERQCIPLLDAQKMGMILACAAGWSAVYLAGSLLAMKKRDI